jgi:hypothetical protein
MTTSRKRKRKTVRAISPTREEEHNNSAEGEAEPDIAQPVKKRSTGTSER